MAKSFRVIDTGDPLETILPGAGLLITAMGVTIAEANVQGVPVAVHYNYQADRAQVKQLVEAGLVADLGFHEEITTTDLAAALGGLWADEARRRGLARNGLDRIDGRGARRVADLVARLWGNGEPAKDTSC